VIQTVNYFYQKIIPVLKVDVILVALRIKFPEVLTILGNVQKILAQQFKEGEALMRHLAER